MKTNIISLVLGDWSDDGHGKTATYVAKSTGTARDIEAAYSAGVSTLVLQYGDEIRGMLDNLCDDYEDDAISGDLREWLIDAGILTFKEECDVFNEFEKLSTGEYGWRRLDPDEDGRLDIDTFAEIYVGIARLGGIDIELVPDTHDYVVKIGGYGLFYG